MEISAKNLNKNSSAVLKTGKKNLSFTGINTGKISNLAEAKKLSKRNRDGIFNALNNKLGDGFIQIGADGTATYKKANALVDTIVYPFTKMPKEFLNSFAKTFKIDNLYNSKMLVDFRKVKENEQCERAMRGFIQNSDTFLKGDNKEDAAQEFYKLFDENLTAGKAKYNTTHERTVARLVSGFLPAVMLGFDFHNKAIKNGKTETEATEEAKNKRKQEMIATMEEAVSQYFLLGAFSGFVNNSTFGAPILNTLLGLGFHITSRLSTGRPLTRIKMPENTQAQQPALSFTSINDFKEAAKNNKARDFILKPSFGSLNTHAEKNDNKKKKHLLSAKNIALACLASIAGGFAIRGLKGTKAFETLNGAWPIKNISDKFKKATIGEIWINQESSDKFVDTLRNTGFKNMQRHYKNELDKAFADPNLVKDGKIFIGEYEKFVKVPLINVKLSKKELYTIPLAPFKIVKEVVSYPYKAVSKALEGISVIKKPKSAKLKNDYNLVNTLLDLKTQAEKFGGDTTSAEFIEHYKKHLEQNRFAALNKETKSNVNNCDIGKLTALLGIFSGIYFATTDDYNSTLKQTGDVEKAKKDARLRGVNKIIRTCTQNVILGLNNLFKIPYSESLIGAGTITAGVTLITDSVSRFLSGMPSKKMNKEELEAYNKNKKEGILKGYYNALDKLTD